MDIQERIKELEANNPGYDIGDLLEKHFSKGMERILSPVRLGRRMMRSWLIIRLTMTGNLTESPLG